MDSQLDRDLKAIVAAVFAMNVHGLLAEPSRLEAVARMVNIPADRVPALRAALHQANQAGLAS